MFSFKKRNSAANAKRSTATDSSTIPEKVEYPRKNMITEYSGNLFCTPEPGHVLVIGGKTVDAAERLDIELRVGKASDDDVLLLISVQFSSDTVVRNAKIEGVWGAEETMEHLDSMATTNPIVAGERFRVYILMAADRFHIALNELNYCTFQYRGALGDIRSLKMSKDLQMVTQVDQRCVYPSPWPLVQTDDDQLSFSNDVPSRFTPGHVIIVTAIPYGNPKGRFVVSFFEMDTRRQAFHFNPRFEHGMVIRNSTKEDLSWRGEEREGEFPFVFDQQFKLAIAMSTTSFLVAVDGKRFCTYRYRGDKVANQLNILNGFKLFCVDGLRLEVTCVDHIYSGSTSCVDFEGYSSPDVELF